MREIEHRAFISQIWKCDKKNEGWTTVEVLWKFQCFPIALSVAFLVGYHSLSINYFSFISAAVILKHYKTKQLRGGDVLFSL